MRRATRTLLAELIREEWRLHARLFGGQRFALFPLLIGLLAAGGALSAHVTGTDASTLRLGTHILIFAFGLYTGTAGLVGTELLERILGDVTLLLSTSQTLPVSRRELLGLFLLKDAGYYSLLLILPVALGFVPLVALGTVSAAAVPWLWVSLLLVFVAGMVLTVTAIAAWTRGVPGWVLGLLAGLGVVALSSQSLLGPAWDALVVFDDGPVAALALTSGLLALGALALGSYDPTYQRPARTRPDQFRAVERWLPGQTNGLVTKTLLDVGRSSGGFAKPLVSVGLLFGLVVLLVDPVAAIIGIEPAPGVFFGGILALSAFTTYNWLTQFDSVSEYLLLPVSIEDIFDAKRVAFLILGAPTAGLGYLAALVLFPTSLLDALLGALVLMGGSLYFYGLTVFVAGFSPNEFLFDTVRFLVFFVGVAVPLIPLLLVGFVLIPQGASLPEVAVTGIAALALGGIGFWLSRRAAAHWTDAYLAG